MSCDKGFSDQCIRRWSNQSNEWWVQHYFHWIRIPAQRCGSAGTSPSYKVLTNKVPWYHPHPHLPPSRGKAHGICVSNSDWRSSILWRLIHQSVIIPGPTDKTDIDTSLPNWPAREFEIVKEHSPLYITRWEGRNEGVNVRHEVQDAMHK